MRSKLKMTEYLEENILHREPRRERRGRMFISPARRSQEDVMMERAEAVRIIDYRFRIGTRVKVTAGAPDEAYREARQRVVRLFMREMFGDFVEELMDLREYVFEEGIGSDVEDRLTRIIALAHGEEVHDVPAS